MLAGALVMGGLLAMTRSRPHDASALVRGKP